MTERWLSEFLRTLTVGKALKVGLVVFAYCVMALLIVSGVLTVFSVFGTSTPATPVTTTVTTTETTTTTP